MHESVRVPIGLVQAAVGGVPAEAFTSIDALRPLKDFDARIAFYERLRQRGGREYSNYIMPWYDEYDIGAKDGSWAEPALDDSSWKAVHVPGDFKELGVAGVPSLTYLRKEVTIPDPLPQGRTSIYLGQVEKMDTVYVNGRQVGSSSWVENPRVYGAGSLKPGKNIITIRLFRVAAQGGGFIDGAASMKLVLGDGKTIPLAGEWKGKVSVDGILFGGSQSEGRPLRVAEQPAGDAVQRRWSSRRAFPYRRLARCHGQKYDLLIGYGLGFEMAFPL